MEPGVDGAARGEDARHEYDISDFEGQRALSLTIEGGLREGDEALAPGAAESDVGIESSSFSGEPVGLQGVL